MRIFTTTWFARFAKRQKINDSSLIAAIEETEQGLVSADLGEHLIKQRIARPGQGKSSGYRTIIVFRKGDRSFFVYGFPKNERGNVDKDELAAFKKAAEQYLALNDDQITELLDTNALTEIIP